MVSQSVNLTIEICATTAPVSYAILSVKWVALILSLTVGMYLDFLRPLIHSSIKVQVLWTTGGVPGESMIGN